MTTEVQPFCQRCGSSHANHGVPYVELRGLFPGATDEVLHALLVEGTAFPYAPWSDCVGHMLHWAKVSGGDAGRAFAVIREATESIQKFYATEDDDL